MRHSVLTVLVSLLFLVSCSSSSDSILGTPYEADWASQAASLVSEALTDPVGDFEIGLDGAPPYSSPVAYSPIDVTQVSYALVDGYFYLQLDFDGTIPSAPQNVPASGEVESQNVVAQSFNFALDTDNSDLTGGTGEGVDGVDLCFGIHSTYGAGFQVIAMYGIPPGPVNSQGGQIQGELGAGGPGSDFVLVRFDVADIGAVTLPRGTAVEVGGWSVAESTLYDGLSTDSLQANSWTIPYGPSNGSARDEGFETPQLRMD